MAEGNGFTLKLVVDGMNNKVLYAEANKDLIDFLFGLLQVPIGRVMRLLKQNKIPPPGSFGRILDSVENLDSKNFISTTHKNLILNPKVSTFSSTPPESLRKFDCFDHFSGYSDPGYVQDVCTTYMVTDDLKVCLLSTSSIFSLLDKGNASFQEKTVKVDFKVGLELLKASWESDTVLTDLFVRDNLGVRGTTTKSPKPKPVIVPMNDEHEDNEGNGRESPKLGMEFDNLDIAWRFWNEYGRRTGFRVRKEYKNTSKTDKVTTSVVYVCSKYGHKRNGKMIPSNADRGWNRISDCHVRLLVCLNRKTRKYVVKGFFKDHNHSLEYVNTPIC